jgi:hypothetical protein
MGLCHFAPESSELLPRSGIHHAADTLNRFRYLHRRRPSLGAFEAHMLYEVASACLLIAFITGAYADEYSYAYRPGGRHVAGNDTQTAFMNMFAVQIKHLLRILLYMIPSSGEFSVNCREWIFTFKLGYVKRMK